ncbi:MAG: alkaline phosphatase PhoX, partial [Cyanobacteria bacterium P01_D01_bin.44]
MNLKRRQFLLFLGAAAGTATLGSLERSQQSFLGLPQAAAAEGMAFSPLKGPLPYKGLNIEAALQKAEYSEYVVQDDLVLAEGLTYDVIGSWGDPVGDSRFGYNNDYLSFVSTGPDAGYLTINFEYISDATWLQTYPTVIGKSLPAEAVMAAIAAQGEGIEAIDAYGLPEGELKSQITDLCKETLLDQGIGVISIKREPDGRWVRTNSASDRRITGMSGLEDDRYLQVTGPATAIFNKQSGQGYLDGLGSQIIGTFGNCSGGTTPWGTVLSAEENIQNQVPEGVYADGTSLAPSEKPFDVSLDGQGNVLGLAGNKYGWIVEVDPSNANDYGTKHTWLGRFRHEGVGVRVEAGKQLAFYSGCDRRGGHVYKFMSTGTVTDPQDKANSGLLADGMLHVAKFNPDGTGQWMALTPSTPVDPVLPSSVVGGLVTLPSRPDGGFEKVEDDAVALSFKSQHATLGDLYEGSELEKQGAILIDAHFAANAAGATSTARPEDTDVRADGTVFIAFTSGLSGGDGGPDKSIFVGPNGEDFEFGWIMKLMEDDSDPAAS